jgi:predicted TIM-barrel fold metal-dependent hydrolase
MDLRSIPIIDTHSHPFDPAREDDDFRVYFNMSLWRPPTEVVKDTVVNRKLMRELGRFLGAPFTATQDEIAAIRNSEYKKDRAAYIRRLFSSVNLEMMLVDTGFPHQQFTGYSVDLKQFAGLVPCKVFPIFRMSPTIYGIFQNMPATLEEAEAILIKDMDQAIKVDKIVAMKSIVAYETGLAIQKWTQKQAAEAYSRYRKEKTRPDEKILREYFLYMGMKKCQEHGLPMQFHTGLGSAPVLNLLNSNPILMQDFLADEGIKETKVVITHSGYPYTTETGYLTSVYPNVYCDVTAITPYFGMGFKKALLNLFDFAPANRIMFGADGVLIPETYWLGYTQGLKVLGQVLDEMVASDWITGGEALEFARMILHDNAKGVYRI